MIFGGYLPFTLNDFPSRIAAIVFTQGCNFRCPFCHNGTLWDYTPPASGVVDEDFMLAFLRQKQGKLDGLVISGGEPTLQPDLPDFIRPVKEMGYAVKLDTNGSRPRVLKSLIERNLVDYIAMDIKAPWPKYSQLAGVNADTPAIRESVNIISRSGIPHQFRTTWVDSLLCREDRLAIRNQIPPASNHIFQAFQPENAQDAELRESEANAAYRVEFMPKNAMAV
ncbi:anaerobic ribonucleoside-triphosphate reductase activating protein [bacterium]|nr:anaerobic ribonucleoside-triphosphate reductase activating protein [bacterium]